MRVISVHLENFGSYKELDFQFSEQGLTLISGPTGVGKSTLMDAVSWCLFARTAKDGGVDEVRSWNAEASTVGTIVVKAGQHEIVVCRTRGKANDLWYQLVGFGGDQVRGKDLSDTQRLINILLGIDFNLFASGSYFHEFSATSQFFTATAKNRRALCEQLVDLSLAKTLTENLRGDCKDMDIAHYDALAQIKWLKDNIEDYKQEIAEYEEKSLTFEEDKEAELRKIAEEIVRLEDKIKPSKYYAQARADLQSAETALGAQTCGECGAPLAHKGLRELHEKRSKLRERELRNSSWVDQVRKLNEAFKRAEGSQNTYGVLSGTRKKQLAEAQKQLIDWKAKEHDLAVKLMDAETLLDVVTTYRAATIRSTIQGLQDTTNKLLGDHFDAEIKVMFEVESADKLDVTILKDGNQCVYTQLSKGQRQLLKLCFGVAVMRTVANRHGVSFNCAFFDEALSGLDDVLKTKAFGLLQQLSTEYESVFVIDHAVEFKELFANKYEISMLNGESKVHAT